MAALAWLLFSLAAGVVDAGHLRGLRGLSEDLGTMLRADVAKAASAFFKTFQIEGNQGGAPAASVDTTASGAHLIQELLSNKKLTDEITLKPTRNGWVQSGRLYDILMKDAHVGKETHVSTQDGLVTFSVEDLSVDVEFRLQGDRQREGPIVRRLHVAGLPHRGLRTRRVPFRQGPRPRGRFVSTVFRSTRFTRYEATHVSRCLALFGQSVDVCLCV